MSTNVYLFSTDVIPDVSPKEPETDTPQWTGNQNAEWMWAWWTEISATPNCDPTKLQIGENTQDVLAQVSATNDAVATVAETPANKKKLIKTMEFVVAED